MRQLAIAVIIVGLGSAFAQEPAQKIALQDVDGGTRTPLEIGENKAVLLFFLLPDCPVSNSYAPEIERIAAAYKGKKIACYIVHGDPDVTAAQAKKHAKEYGLTCPVLLDPAHRLAKKAGATMAPEAAVLDRDGKVLYRGRIDDWYADYGKRRVEPRERDLRNALDAIVQGKAVAAPTTKVIGCHLPPAKQ